MVVMRHRPHQRVFSLTKTVFAFVSFSYLSVLGVSNKRILNFMRNSKLAQILVYLKNLDTSWPPIGSERSDDIQAAL